MSHTHHIGDSAESVNRSAAPLHPLTQAVELDSPGCRDALNNCAATLYMLADLFGDTDMERYPVLDSAAARRGMFLQLFGVADTLEAIKAFLEREAERAFAEREAAREAERKAEREVEDRIAADPVLNEKAITLGKVFGELYRQMFSPEPATETV